MKKQTPLTQHGINQARWMRLIVLTVKHEWDCNCEEHQEMRTLGTILSEQYEADFQERKIRINNYLVNAVLKNEVNCKGCNVRMDSGDYCADCITDLSVMEKPDYFQKTLNPSKSVKVGNFRI